MKLRSYQTKETLGPLAVWTSSGIKNNLIIELENGVVKKISQASGGQFSKTPGRLLIPAGVDPQVHFRYPGQPTKENLETVSRAALRGGYAAALGMPNTNPTIDNYEVAKQVVDDFKEIYKKFGVQFFQTGCITQKMQGESLAPFEDLKKAGVVALTDDGIGVESNTLMLQAFKNAASLKLPLLQHAEMPGHEGVLHASSVQQSLGVPSYPSSAEFDMVARDLELLEKVPEAQYHLLHASCIESVDLVRKAKKQGLRVTCEVTPHHLYFCGEDIDPKNPSFKMNPPIRSAQDREALMEGLIDGTIDWVATDHAPHERELKKDFLNARFGTLGLETSLPVLFDFYLKGRLTLNRMIEVFSLKPAEFLNLKFWNEQGPELAKPLHALILNLQPNTKKWQEGDYQSLSQNCCFTGVELPDPLESHFTPAGEWILR